MEVFLLTLLGVSVVVTSLLVMWGTVFGVQNVQRNPWVLLWYWQCILVIVPVVLVAILGIENARVLFAAVPGTEFEIGLLVLLTLLIYIISLRVFLAALQVKIPRSDVWASLSKPYLSRLATVLTVVGLGWVLVFYLLGYRHAFLASAFGDATLLQIRLANVYTSRVPSQLAPIVPLIGYLLAFLAGLLYGLKSRYRGLLYLAFALFFASIQGDKAPPLNAGILWVMSIWYSSPRKWGLLKMVKWLSLLSVTLLVGLFVSMQLQQPGFTVTEFVGYLLGRLGVGQMAGVYETFGLAHKGIFPEGPYFWHAIPGANFFVDYLDFQKVLMMVTEGYDVHEMGVKNTYFVAEAYAIGGYWLVWLSPIIVALSTAVGLITLTRIMRFFVAKPVAPQLSLMLYLMTQNITGGFSHFPFLKGVILLVLLLSLIFLPVRLFVSSAYYGEGNIHSNRRR